MKRIFKVVVKWGNRDWSSVLNINMPDDDPAYCPDSPSHRHSWFRMSDVNSPICEYCGRVEE